MTKLEFRELVEETIGHGELGLLLTALFEEFVEDSDARSLGTSVEVRDLDPSDVPRFADIISTHLELED